MNLNDIIYRRKSVRSYTDEKVNEDDLQKIKDFLETAKPLYPDIKVRAEITGKENIKCVLPLPWIPKQYVVIYSEDKTGAYENVGFIFQQLDLYLQSIGIGTCWLGLGRVNGPKASDKEDMKFMIMLAFGYPEDELRQSTDEFKRHTLSEISDSVDERLEPARLAPSAVNSQPWYFVHDGDVIHAYCAHNKMLKDMNKIDMGICLAHMYVSNPDTFSFCKIENAAEVKGHYYTGSFTL